MSNSPSVPKTKWNRETTCCLISSYHAHPQLWDTESDDYKYSTKRKEALQEMAREFECSTEEIEKKITSIRAQFLRELGLVEAKKQTASGEPYSPKWYAYKKLGFLAGKSASRVHRHPKATARAGHISGSKKHSEAKHDGDVQERVSKTTTPKARELHVTGSQNNPEAKHGDIQVGVSTKGTPKARAPKFSEKKKNLEPKHDGDDVQKGISSLPKTISLIASTTEDRTNAKDIQESADKTTREQRDVVQVNENLQFMSPSTSRNEIGSCPNAPARLTSKEHKTIHRVPDSTFPVHHHSDEFTIFGEYVATTLRKLSGQYLQCYAKHEINDILFHVEAQDCRSDNLSTINVNRDTITFRNIPQQSLNYFDLNAPTSNTNQ